MTVIDRVEAELGLIRSEYPGLEFRDEDLWARIPAYPVSPDWGTDEVELAFQVPPDLFGQAPYGFWVRPMLLLPGGGFPTNSNQEPVVTGFGAGWQQFSWTPELWQPGPEPLGGTNLLDWVRSFAGRLGELN
jgi:hypothetical protein